MDRRGTLMAVAGAILLAVAAATVAYNVGVSHAMAVNAAVPGTGSALPPYYWHRPWGFGFGFAPFFFILFWFFVLRFFLWGGPFHRPRWYHTGPYDGAAFEEWHRQAHQRMGGSPSEPRTQG